MIAVGSEFERGDGKPPKEFFSQKLTCEAAEVFNAVRRLMQCAFLRGDAIDVI